MPYTARLLRVDLSTGTSSAEDVDQDVLTYHSGMEFVELPERVRMAIEKFLAAVKAHRAGAGS